MRNYYKKAKVKYYKIENIIIKIYLKMSTTTNNQTRVIL